MELCQTEVFVPACGGVERKKRSIGADGYDDGGSGGDKNDDIGDDNDVSKDDNNDSRLSGENRWEFDTYYKNVHPKVKRQKNKFSNIRQLKKKKTKLIKYENQNVNLSNNTFKNSHTRKIKKRKIRGAPMRREQTIILIKKAIIGRMWAGRCLSGKYGHIGCFADVTRELGALCTGKKSCHVHVSSAILLDSSPCPKDLASFLFVSYVCVSIGECLC